MGIIRCDFKMVVVPMWDVLKYFREKGLWHYAKICDTMTGFVTLCLCTTLHRFQWILPAILCNLTLFCCWCCSQCRFWWIFCPVSNWILKFSWISSLKFFFQIPNAFYDENSIIRIRLKPDRNSQKLTLCCCCWHDFALILSLLMISDVYDK